MAVALDATYSVGESLSGVGIYSHEILYGLAEARPGTNFRWCFRPHRIARGLRSELPPNCSRGLFGEKWFFPPGPELFHGLNQRMPSGMRFRHSVCTFHDLFVMTGEYSSPEFRERFTKQAREAASRADLIVTVSDFTGSQVSDLLGVEPSRIRTVHHGIRPLPSPARCNRENIILHVGAIQRRKNVARLVRAFERVPPPWRLVLAGSADGYGADEALAAVESSDCRSRIEVTGYVNTEELGSLYARASVFAFPSLDEGFGMPVLEAMSRGVSVIASDRSALPEVCGDAAMIVNAESDDELTHALLCLTADPSLRDHYATRGLRRAAQFTWSAAVSRTLAVYSEALGRTL